MTRRAWMPVITAEAFALAVPTYAQDKGQAGARPNTGGGGGGGSAVSRPSGGGGGGSSSGGSTSSSSPSSGGSSSVSRPSGGDDGDRGGYRPSAPERRSGPSAVPRAGSSDRSNGEGRRAGSNGATAASSLSSDDNGGQRRAVPTYSRPRDGRPVIGTAVGRTTGVYPPISGGHYPYYRYGYYYNHYPYGYFWPSYGFGVGYFYDPWMWGYAPYSFYGYGGGYGGGYYGSTYGNGRQYRDVGGVRLKVRPVEGQVYVDGYYVGEVDNFDGMFQKLTLESGAHRIEIRAEGYLPEQFEVMVVPGETITYKGDLKLAGRK